MWDNRHVGALSDTIVARVTAPGRGALAIVRVSGPDAWTIVGSVFRPWPSAPESHRALHGRFAHGDEGLALPFATGRGYTGEESVELMVHGAPVSVQGLIQGCLAAGARLAEPGEFTLRAFMNGRIDLARAEAVREVIEARTPAQLRSAYELNRGALSLPVRSIADRAHRMMVEIDAHADFQEEIGDFDVSGAKAGVEAMLADLAALLDRARKAVHWRDGVRIAICGRPNAGKSSLLNALAGVERAIVTDIPGTTRDTIEEMADVGGVPCVLVDTAGLRVTNDPVEAIGVERAWDTACASDACWYLYDASVGWRTADDAILRRLPEGTLVVAAKCDLPHGEGPGLRISVRSAEGLDALAEAVRVRFGATDAGPHAMALARHVPLLERAADGLALAAPVFGSPLPLDLARTGLDAAHQALAELLGEGVRADVLDALFADFCIGK